MKRVLIWPQACSPAIGGLEVITSELALTLRSRGFDVHLLGQSPGPESYQGIPVHRIAQLDEQAYAPENVGERLYLPVRRLKLKLKPDLVHLNGLSNFIWLHLFTHRAWPTPTILGLHGPWAESLNNLACCAFERFERITACSSYTLDRIRRFAPEARDRVVLTPNALPVPPAAPRPMPEEPTLLVLGRLAPEKGFDLALRALALLREEFPAVRMTIGGSGSVGDGLAALVDELKLERVTFLGPVSREAVPRVLNDSTIVLVPSRLEGFGLTALEAAQMGRPVVATRVGGLPEVVIDQQTGMLIPPEDPEALAEAVRSLLRSPKRLRQMGARARHEALKRFVWDDYVDGYANLYRELTS